MYIISECCGSIPWNDTDICSECKEHADFISHVEYNTKVLSQTPMRNRTMNQKILELVEERLDKGRKKYGHENVETDGRNFVTEALEEILDCNVYVAAKLIEIQNREELNESDA